MSMYLLDSMVAFCLSFFFFFLSTFLCLLSEISLLLHPFPQKKKRKGALSTFIAFSSLVSLLIDAQSRLGRGGMQLLGNANLHFSLQSDSIAKSPLQWNNFCLAFVLMSLPLVSSLQEKVRRKKLKKNNLLLSPLLILKDFCRLSQSTSYFHS